MLLSTQNSFNWLKAAKQASKALKLVKQRTANKLRQCVFRICVVNDWNSLDEVIVISHSWIKTISKTNHEIIHIIHILAKFNEK